MFDLSVGKILVLLVIALVIFGPDQLPKMAKQAGGVLRDLRKLADAATRDLKENLGPEFEDFDVTDLHPKNFVRKHLLDDQVDLDDLDPRKFVRKHLLDEPREDRADMPAEETTAVDLLEAGETPPYDAEAT